MITPQPLDSACSARIGAADFSVIKPEPVDHALAGPARNNPKQPDRGLELVHHGHRPSPTDASLDDHIRFVAETLAAKLLEDHRAGKLRSINTDTIRAAVCGWSAWTCEITPEQLQQIELETLRSAVRAAA